MIKVVSKVLLARPNDVVRVIADLIPKADEIGNFSIETANPGFYWGTAVAQLPRDIVMPKFVIAKSFAGVVHTKQPRAEMVYPCLNPTWVRVVQYLSADQIPSVTAKIEISDLRFRERWKRKFSREKFDPPTERVF